MKEGVRAVFNLMKNRSFLQSIFVVKLMSSRLITAGRKSGPSSYHASKFAADASPKTAITNLP
jgi:hypothetical protein